ncbi:MAG: hypothetical protein V2I57_06190 [Xanthomonadales bacterium]|jgi:hypothetical protein|nr:hypothetical protein [Xanthomonadales bacterium]
MTDSSFTPRDPGVRRLVNSHLLYGAAGVVLGLIASFVAINFGPQFLKAEPVFTFVALTLVMAIGTSMIGGLLAMTAYNEQTPADARPPTDV